MHGADWDIPWLQRDFGLYVVNMFDTGVATHVLQLPKHSLAFLLQYCCGVEADKQYQLADWRIRSTLSLSLSSSASSLPLSLLQSAGPSPWRWRSMLGRTPTTSSTSTTG